ncbi:MAG: hypothetical protein MZU84_03850 [Sphingobacterium sp.]|nr:hypothetical protein [Sphingobacterium sp.]
MKPKNIINEWTIIDLDDLEKVLSYGKKFCVNHANNKYIQAGSGKKAMSLHRFFN